MYELLHRFATRPTPHVTKTVKTLWTRHHGQMLACHLDQGTNLASRPEREIEKIVDALDRELVLRGKTLCDLGCGPGLYARRFADRGAMVTGVDISTNSIAYARRQRPKAGKAPSYVVADYLADDVGCDFDVVTLIYFDYCALSPSDRRQLLNKIHGMLKPGGVLVLDVLSERAFAAAEEMLAIEDRLMDGFWSATDYVGIHRRWIYPELFLTLDHFGICETGGTFEIFNWMQYFSEESLGREIEQADFTVDGFHESLRLASGPDPGASNEIAVIAKKSSAL